MSQNDFTEQLQEWIAEAKAVKPTQQTATPPPSWYDIYRYATDESEWYEKERTRLVASGAKLDAIEESVRQSNFFDEIREVADIQMMNVCLQIAKANGIENPFAADYGTT